jgi:hypothetical protein
MNFFEEIKDYSLEELEEIIQEQEELYTEEEFNQLKQRYEELSETQSANIEDETEKTYFLPVEIHCEKCDAPSPSSNETCPFCGHKFDKSKYYIDVSDDDDDDEEEDEEEEDDDDSVASNSFTFHYIASFFIPLVGFIIGAILLSSDDSEKQSVGKACIILGIISTLISAITPLTIFLLL